MIFKKFNLTDDEVEYIIENYKNLIHKYSKINGIINEDLAQEIAIEIYIATTKNREKLKNF